ncbi:methionine synthase [Corynebacterium sp. MSK044]|uniref:methionine synthase n=1 Tax=Corynebacterium sp. MSK044 TaxID=3050195 RepID=UPI00254F3692|nr:methionine synthase [Corynebacterium sp. MSK044]MDK8797453.1 methionine synthase [Corynebacterium sp. MSK044]
MTAFGLGPMPGTDLVQAADVVLSELPTPHLPQLPARGVGSDLIGRTAALLPLNLDIGPRSWRVTRRPQIATMRARDQFERDLDLLEELWAGKLTELKVQLVGPWTLAAQLEMTNGHRMITDRGATREIAEALEYAAGEHRSDVEKRFGVSTLLQLDEPALTRVRGGTLTGTTDYEDIPAVPEERLLEAYEPFGEHLLNTPDPLYAADWFTVNLAGDFDWDALAGALDRGARIAVPVMEPRDVFNIFDQLQIDPALTTIDVYGEAGPTLLDTAAKFSAATEMANAVATVD